MPTATQVVKSGDEKLVLGRALDRVAGCARVDRSASGKEGAAGT